MKHLELKLIHMYLRLKKREAQNGKQCSRYLQMSINRITERLPRALIRYWPNTVCFFQSTISC